MGHSVKRSATPGLQGSERQKDLSKVMNLHDQIDNNSQLFD